MEKPSIYDVFERMWQHILVKFNSYVPIETLNDHIENKNNPHGVTAEQIGLENVDNTADLDKPISNDTQAALDEKADVSHTHFEYADVNHTHDEYADIDHTHSNATTSSAGFMSANDKYTLNTLNTLVGNTKVSTQIANAIDQITPNKISALPEVLTSEHYGDSLPSAGTIGRIFFKRVVE